MEKLNDVGGFFVFLLIMTIVLFGLFRIADLIVETVFVEPTCESFGYASGFDNRFGRFCVGYTNGEPYIVNVETIDGWTW